jgi:TPR repeat protein
MNGQAGLKRNGSEALRFFERSANASDPFPMSLHVAATNIRWAWSEEEEEMEEMEEVDTVNLYRQNNFPSHLQTQRGRYLTLGRKYYEQAAELNSPEGATVNPSHSLGCPLSCPSCHRPLQLGD